MSHLALLLEGGLRPAEADEESVISNKNRLRERNRLECEERGEDGGLVVGYELPVEVQYTGQDLVDTRFQRVLTLNNLLYPGQFEQVLIGYVQLGHFSFKMRGR